jgi:hypothetical protein
VNDFFADGYNIMRVLGNRLTLQSPSRGYSMELGSAITVILASQYGIPVSTTMCITGATLCASIPFICYPMLTLCFSGVGLCNGDREYSSCLINGIDR